MSCRRLYPLRYHPSVHCNIRDQTTSNKVKSTRELVSQRVPGYSPKIAPTTRVYPGSPPQISRVLAGREYSQGYTSNTPLMQGYLSVSPLTKGVGTTTKTMSACAVASATVVVATISSLSLIPGRYGVFSCDLGVIRQADDANSKKARHMCLCEHFQIATRCRYYDTGILHCCILLYKVSAAGAASPH